MRHISFFIVLFLVLDILREFEAQNIIDSRCYLEGGGSTENFIVNEDISVGSILGQLRVNGDPSPSGNVILSLRERDRNSPVQIEQGTKDLVLIAPIDKEGIRGPSSVYINVICDRKHSLDPSFVIPVNIRVQDVNDNSPVWVGNPYKISLSEVTVPGTRILQGARAVDADQQGPFSTVEYQVLPGAFSDYVDFLSPLEGTMVLKKPLDYEQTKNFTVRLRAQDQGTPPKFSDTTLKIMIIDADDQNPKFKYEAYRGELPPNGKVGRVKIYPEAIRAYDQDEGIQALIQYSISSSPDARFFSINPKTADIDLITPAPVSLTAHPITLVIRATQTDNKDRYALATLVISSGENLPNVKPALTAPVNANTIPNLNNVNTVNNNVNKNQNNFATSTNTNTMPTRTSALAFLQSKFETKVHEDTLAGTRILALPTNKPEKYLQYTILDKEQNDYFLIGKLGEVVLKRSLDYEKYTKHVFNVMASDELNNATTQVIVNVENVNDWEPRFRQPYYRFTLPPDATDNETSNVPMAIGKIEAADGDINDKITFSLKGSHASMFTVDNKGIIWLKAPIMNSKLTDINLLAMATDSGLRSASVPVTLVMDPSYSELNNTGYFPGLLGIMSAIILICIFIILLITIFVYKRKSKGANRVHSNLPSMQSSANLVTHEKRLMNAHLQNYDEAMVEQNNFCGSGSSLSAGASTILAASLEREAQQQSEHKSSSGLLSRNGAYRGRFFGNSPEEIENDSINNSETAIRAFNPKDLNLANKIITKKLSWEGSNQQRHDPVNMSTGSMDLNGSTENNLIVYF